MARVKGRRIFGYGASVLELSGPDVELQLKLVSRLGARERRAIIRSFLQRMRPWLHYFTYRAVDHSSDCTIRDTRNSQRDVRDVRGNAGPDTVGFEIRMARLRLGLSQQELARTVGIQRTHLSGIERGLHKPHLETLKKLESALGVTLIAADV